MECKGCSSNFRTVETPKNQDRICYKCGHNNGREDGKASTTKSNPTTPMSQWGKDHWSLLAYVETRCVEYKGQLDRKHLSLDGKKYPLRLNNGIAKGKNELDALKDLQNEGLILIENFASLEVRMTDLGNDMAAQLRKHKAAGGQFADFNKLDRQKMLKIVE